MSGDMSVEPFKIAVELGVLHDVVRGESRQLRHAEKLHIQMHRLQKIIEVYAGKERLCRIVKGL